MHLVYGRKELVLATFIINLIGSLNLKHLLTNGSVSFG